VNAKRITEIKLVKDGGQMNWAYNIPKHSNEGECDDCTHNAEAHDLSTPTGGLPCTIEGCECAFYVCHVDAMIDLGDALYHRAKEEGSFYND
jgi:hypothetical protein